MTLTPSSPNEARRTRWGVALGMALLIVGSLGQWWLDTTGRRALDFWQALGSHGIATSGYVLLGTLVWRGAWQPSLWQVLGLAFLLRLLMLPLGPGLSDDVYRYIHEGSMVLCGENPYLTAPLHVSAEFRHPEYWELINHPEIPAAYPPLVQYFLAMGVSLSASPMGMKLVFGACDLAVTLALWRYLQASGRRPELALLHGCCPLVALEFAGEGHSDSLAVLCVVLTLWFAARDWLPAAAAALAGAVAAKFLPLALLPFLLRKRWGAAWSFAAVLVALYVPFLWGLAPSEYGQLLAGSREYASRWRGNDSVFHLLHAAVESGFSLLSHWGVDTQLRYFPHQVCKGLLALGTLSLLGYAWFRRFALEHVSALFFGVFVAATPMMHPWYLGFLVPFFCIYPQRWWWLFSGTIYLAYHTRPEWILHGQVTPNVWLKVLSYVPFYVGCCWYGRGRRTL